MTAISGIGVSEELTQAFSTAVETKNTRFIIIVIRNESLVPVVSVDVAGSLEDDLGQLGAHLDDKDPCYILTRLDDPASEWLAIAYVPEIASVRDKMLYASTRNSLTKSLGSTVFTDSLFATSKADVTPEAYAAHKRHLAAPKPLSAREQEIADIKAAEREAGVVYEGSRARQNHLGQGKVGYQWSSEAEDAVRRLGNSEGNHLVVLVSWMDILLFPTKLLKQIDISTETVVLNADSNVEANTLTFSLFAWSNTYSTTGRDIVFIYSCPSSSLIKYRMVYSSGALVIFRESKALLDSTSNFSLAPRKLETSDPSELSETYLKQELGFSGGPGNNSNDSGTKAAFMRPRGPTRRRG
ncbi:actin depolymerizing protein [Scleroderma citrinum]